METKTTTQAIQKTTQTTQKTFATTNNYATTSTATQPKPVQQNTITAKPLQQTTQAKPLQSTPSAVKLADPKQFETKTIPQSFENKFKIYKPNKAGAGSAVQFDFNVEKKSVFVEAAKQTAPQAFDWSNKLTFKMAVIDIAKLLIVLNGKAANVELFHDPSKGGYATSSDTRNSTVSFSKMASGYYFKLSTQGQDGKVNSIATSVSEDEAIVLKILLEKAIEKIYKW